MGSQEIINLSESGWGEVWGGEGGVRACCGRRGGFTGIQMGV